jgi:hypothetical protein
MALVGLALKCDRLFSFSVAPLYDIPCITIDADFDSHIPL